jgi:cbb3-type cytochrome oxidase subunit 1
VGIVERFLASQSQKAQQAERRINAQGSNTMTGLASRFFGSAIVYALLGMTLGLIMGMTGDHSQMPTHAHLMLLGWVSFALFGVVYHLFPSAAANRLAPVQCWVAEISLIVLIVGLFLLFSGQSSADPVAAIGATGLLASMILFAIIAWPVVRGAK